MLTKYIWPMIILISTLLAVWATTTTPGSPLRGTLIMWFLFVCPGMALVKLFHFGTLVIELTLALAVGISIDAIVAGCFLYAGHWSPMQILIVLVIWSDIGAIIQIVDTYNYTAEPQL